MSDLKKAYELEMSKAKEILLEMPWDDPAFYAEWMAQTYFYCSYTTRIIGLAGALFPVSRDKLHGRFFDHAREEKNHERIILNDLRAMGKTIDQYSCFSSTAALYRTQYYWIQNVDPMSVYGYFLYLEGIAVEHGSAIVEAVRKGIPEKSLKFLKVHVEEDVGHMNDHFKILADVTPEETEMIRENMERTADYYTALLKEAAEKSGSRRLRKSA
ncbi:MAG TPA: iron-containing redox enzyme family protein [Pseudobdellovibrionaceae bacterium]|nr:iron-containing redox enzyme family protein [Pseudobdellovibrionaceae bacterium]